MRLGGESLAPTVPLQSVSGLLPKGTRVDVFQQIYWVFLILGTLVGIVVIGYMLYNAYKYRDRPDRADDGDTPRLGELPTGSGGGRKLFFSFGLSTIIVVSLIVWTYGTLLYVEEETTVEGDDAVQIEVVGYQFGWDFIYPNGHENDTLYVPQGETIHLEVTSDDVFHAFGVPELRVKTDSIPGQTTNTWFQANETGTYEARCYELCGSSHSYMTAEVVVMEPDEYEEWYANTSNSSDSESLAADGALAARASGASAEVAA